MNLQQYVAARKVELDEFLTYNEAKLKEHGDDWMPAEQDAEEWLEQENAWLDMKHNGDLD